MAMAHTQKAQVQRSVGLKDRPKTNRRTVPVVVPLWLSEGQRGAYDSLETVNQLPHEWCKMASVQ